MMANADAAELDGGAENGGQGSASVVRETKEEAAGGRGDDRVSARADVQASARLSARPSDRAFRITVVSAGISEPSTTSKLGEAVALHAAEYLREQGVEAEVKLVSLKALSQDIAVAGTSYRISEKLREAIATIRASDGLVAASPISQASFSGLFKSFWDVVDTDLVLAMPVALTATGGSERHALVADTSMRALFAFFRAIVAPTTVMAASGDWSDESLSRRELREGRELGAMIFSGVRGVVLDAAGNNYRRSFDANADAVGGDNGAGSGGASQQLNFDSDLMRLAAGGLPRPDQAGGSAGRPTRPPVAKGKARHRWSKEISDIAFQVDAYGSKATVIWRRRDEMVIKAGALMRRDAPLNKDGSLGFEARFAQQLRAEHHVAFKDFRTSEDIVLKSVNEVGLFLYFGGTNGWLTLVDEHGKSINDWAVVN